MQIIIIIIGRKELNLTCYTKVTNHGKQNVTLTFKVKSQFYNEMHQNHDILQKVCGTKWDTLILKIIGQFSSVTALKS